MAKGRYNIHGHLIGPANTCLLMRRKEDNGISGPIISLTGMSPLFNTVIIT